MGLINVQTIDVPDVDQTQFGPDMKRWLANLVDTLNNNFDTISQALAITSADVSNTPSPISTVSVPGMLSSGTVTVNLLSSTNPVKVATVVPGTNQFTVTFSADPGAHAIIQYSAYVGIPQ